MIVELLRLVLLATAPPADPNIQVGQEIYPVQLPDAATFPAIVITKISGLGQEDLQGAIRLEDARAQLDFYAEGYENVVALKTWARRALEDYRGNPASGDPCAVLGIFVINDSDLPVPETERAGPRLRRRMLDLRIWNRAI
jgi:hypothetical protein